MSTISLKFFSSCTFGLLFGVRSGHKRGRHRGSRPPPLVAEEGSSTVHRAALLGAVPAAVRVGAKCTEGALLLGSDEATTASTRKHASRRINVSARTTISIA